MVQFHLDIQRTIIEPSIWGSFQFSVLSFQKSLSNRLSSFVIRLSEVISLFDCNFCYINFLNFSPPLMNQRIEMKSKRSNRWVFIPVIFSFLLLAAHFSRNDQFIFVILSLGIPFFLILKQAWAKIIVQAALILGAFKWVWSTLDYIDARKAIGDDYQRLAIILFSVAAFTLISGILLYLVKNRK